MLMRSALPSAPVRAQSLALLDRHLAATIDLHGQVKHAQWNLRGPGVASVHEPLDKVAIALGHYSDLMAVQADMLGGTVQGTVQAAAARSFLAPYPLDRATAPTHAVAVVGAMEALAHSVRRAGAHARGCGDKDTAALLDEVARGIERQIWTIGSLAAAAADHLLRSRTRAGGSTNGIRPDRPARRATDRPAALADAFATAAAEATP